MYITLVAVKIKKKRVAGLSGVGVWGGHHGRPGRGSPEIGLVVAIPKGKMMDLVVQKAVELGVDQIQPLVTEHTVVRLEDGSGADKREKWQRVALEACKQCGRRIQSLRAYRRASPRFFWHIGNDFQRRRG